MLIKRLIEILILTSICVITANAQSQRPTPSTGVLTKPIHKHSTTKQQPSEGDQRGTEQSPLIVKTINSPKTQAEVDQDRKDHAEKATSDRLLVRYTGYLALLAFLQLLIFIFQAVIFLIQVFLLRGTLSATEKAANAAKESADALKNAERAHLYVFVRRYPDIEPGRPITNIQEGYNIAKITAMNFGKTPAIIIKFNHILGVFTDKEIDNKLSEMKTNPSIFPSEIIVVTQEKEWGHIAECNISAHDEIDIGISAEYACFGRLDYRDVFGAIHEMTFCWKDNGVFFVPDPERCKQV